MKTRSSRVSILLLVFLSVLSYAQAPVPFVNQPLVPDATAPGGPQFTLTVNGTGFVSSSVVNWNGSALATQFVNSSQLTATVPAADIATANTASVTVVNPPPGGGTSNVAFFPVTANTGNLVGFRLGSTLATGAGPSAVAVGDFNGDGKLDLAVANMGEHTVSILLGDGAGNFTLASTPTVGTGPDSVEVGDFNGDGKLDLAVVNEADTLSILLGNGTGNFTLASSPAVGHLPTGVTVGDFNGDGKLDLAVANSCQAGFCTPSAVSILLGDGTGNFTLAYSISDGPGEGWPYSAATGDFNGDGNLDLVVTDCGSPIPILLGDGTGNFILAPSTFWAPPYAGPTSPAAADFNGDGKLDVAVANKGYYTFDNTLDILLGDGAGNLTLASSPVVGSDPNSLVVGDFNADGKLDLAVANIGDHTVSILLGDGTGNFTLTTSPPVGNQPSYAAVGDFNGDGKLDLAVANQADNTVSILLAVQSGPAVMFYPTSLTFGPQLYRTNSAPQLVTLTNSGVEMLNITRVVTSANFSQTNNCPRQLPPGGQCTANVVFTPHNVNTINGTISIYDNAPDSPQNFPLTGVGTAVTLLPSSLGFGSQTVGTTSQPQTVTLTNYAPKAVTISGGEILGSSSFERQSTTCGHSLPPGASCTINIVFAPKSKGDKSATLEVNDNAGASPQTVALSGYGTP